MLEGVGLGDVEERAYRVLLHHASLSVRELADELEVSAVVARRAADRLVADGLVAVLDGSPVRFAPVDPALGLTALIRTRQAELERATSAVQTYAADFHERTLRSEPHRLVEVLEGPTAITERVTEVMRGAQREVLAFDAPPYVAAEPNAPTAEGDVLARGVRVRAVYATEVLSVEGRTENIREIVALGEQARIVPHVPLKMVVVDGETAVIPLTDSEEGTRTAAVVVRRSRLCDALVELFEATWSQGAPLFTPPAADADGELSAVDRDLLALLAAGLKDEAVGRQLGLSERTVRRHIADLVVRLGATSRFQAGAQAVRRGWV
ncbi:helix-turn-helix domain-containing protein [Luteimicrobium sp. NPDC057192]|uniref:helix-turn-helix domain-containing protein n=1 Tax=Luteimicrobium sp. NPDC057192 TaxID=3346042 RepID=UPI0036452C2B